MNVTITVDSNDLLNKLNILEQFIDYNTKKTAFSTFTAEVDETNNHTPVDTGKLLMSTARENISVVNDDQAHEYHYGTGTNVEYAPYIEYGHRYGGWAKPWGGEEKLGTAKTYPAQKMYEKGFVVGQGVMEQTVDDLLEASVNQRYVTVAEPMFTMSQYELEGRDSSPNYYRFQNGTNISEGNVMSNTPGQTSTAIGNTPSGTQYWKFKD